MIHAATLLLYIAALVLWLRALARGARGRGPAVAGWVAATGVAAHFLALLQYVVVYGELPLVGLAPSLSTLAFLTGVGLLFTLVVGEAGRVGILLVPLIVCLEGAAVAMGVEPTPADMDFRGAWFALHVTLALASIGAVSVAAAAGALYLAQFRELKRKRLGKAFRFLPPLDTLDRVGRAGMATGLTTLTLSLALGFAWTYRFRSFLGAGEPKTLWGVFIWAVILAALWARRGTGGERRGAVASTTAFVVIVLSYLVVRVVEGGGLFL